MNSKWFKTEKRPTLYKPFFFTGWHKAALKNKNIKFEEINLK